MEILNIGVVGMGGYARHVSDALVSFGANAAPSVRLAATCDPDLVTHAARAASLRSQGIRVAGDIDELLKLPLDAVWLPVPIELHRPFTEKALAAGKAVIVEKPLAGSIDDVEAIRAARDKSGLPVAVGFQNLFDSATLDAKRRLLRGAVGRPRTASVFACWPRGDSYFQRNKWAGKLKHNGTWVLDSPANNAMAHFINLALFLLGPTERESAVPVAVEAELYRVNPIENYDTCTMRYTLPGGTQLTVALTHACRATVDATIAIHGDGGAMDFINGSKFDFHSNTAGETASVSSAANLMPSVITGFAAYVRGDPSAQVATIENARAHTVAINSASQAGEIRDVPGGKIESLTGDGGKPLRFIPGIETALQACAAKGVLLHESAQVDWSAPAKGMRLEGYRHFELQS